VGPAAAKNPKGGRPEHRRAWSVGTNLTADVEFIDENGGGPGVRLRERQRPKKPK